MKNLIKNLTWFDLVNKVKAVNNRITALETAPTPTVLVGTTAPASASATGTAGEVRVVVGFVYTCVATDTWERAATATW